MNKLFRTLAAAGIIAILAVGSAFAQQAVAVQQSGSRLDAGGGFVFAPTPALNQATTTITIPASSGNCAYLTSLIVAFGSNATGVTGVQTFTSTNLGGLAWSFFPVVVVTSPTTPNFSQQLIGATPLKSSSCGVATTIVSPSGTVATNAYPMVAAGYYAQ